MAVCIRYDVRNPSRNTRQQNAKDMPARPCRNGNALIATSLSAWRVHIRSLLLLFSEFASFISGRVATEQFRARSRVSRPFASHEAPCASTNRHQRRARALQVSRSVPARSIQAEPGDLAA